MAAQCKSCRAAIVWAVSSTTGSKIPLDAEPVATGAGLFYRDGENAIQVGAAQPVFRNHFLTCVSAGQHRRPAGEPLASRRA